jgi:two-component system chemotaxis response regulator CheB
MIRVLVVDDTPVAREFLVYALSSEPEIQVVGTASNGEEALEAVALSLPDVITMDVHMPKLNGLDATRRIMETHPTPIVVVSGSSNRGEAPLAFTALEAGALAVVEPPPGNGHPDQETMVAHLIRTVKLMSEVRVVRRWARRLANTSQGPVSGSSPLIHTGIHPSPRVELIAIGASTGGPPVLQRLLSTLPADLPVPLLIVQHISPGFGEGFAEWLRQTSKLPIHIASHGERTLPGHVYLAQDGLHMGIGSDGRLSLTEDPPENGHRPSVSYLLRSVAKSFGERSVGVLLTGMGKDGAEELKLMKDLGAVTLAQDKESSVVHGMPGEAIQMGGATFVLAPDHIAAILARLANPNPRL